MSTKPYALRLPDDVYVEVERLAKDDTRSINAEIVALLKEAIAARQQADVSRPAKSE